MPQALFHEAEGNHPCVVARVGITLFFVHNCKCCRCLDLLCGAAFMHMEQSEFHTFFMVPYVVLDRGRYGY